MHYFSSREHWRVVSAFQWLLIVSDLRSMSLWEGDENCWCIFFGSNVSASRNTERAMYWKWDVSGLRGNLLKLPELTVHGLLSLRFDESSMFCFNISRTDFFFHVEWWKLYIFYWIVWIVLCFVFVDFISAIIKWCLAAWWRKKVICYAFLFESLSANKIPLADW